MFHRATQKGKASYGKGEQENFCKGKRFVSNQAYVSEER